MHALSRLGARLEVEEIVLLSPGVRARLLNLALGGEVGLVANEGDHNIRVALALQLADPLLSAGVGVCPGDVEDDHGGVSTTVVPERGSGGKGGERWRRVRRRIWSST